MKNKTSLLLCNKLSIVIPAKNEEEVIFQTMEALKEYVKVPYEVVVVDDSSTDQTRRVVKEFANNNQNVLLCSTDGSKVGFSNAIRQGIEKASGDIVVIVMADLCDDPQTINSMYAKITEGWDVVCGSRYAKGGKKIGGPGVQSFFSALVCKSLHYIIGITTKDASNAFKMFRKNITKDLQYKEDRGVEASLEFILGAYFKGFRIVDISTTWRGRTWGQSKFKLIERSPRYFRIYVWALMNRLKQLISI